ncbi:MULTISPECIES: filamentous hemagglutinin N-terminal domain-containing protein [unclassified Moorena]|uniref:two-partner secretion domain-containing protein n=1 Tax=unclassified Moorena TaxID=2683338 RepID=UPI0013FE93B1|nr:MULTISPECIES: filamentous hemagglutinin N-terminal domain-containing protein [unclassified Moorena]NEO12701.1 filamentous hemagglutinin N-terminal domain-containing protein [Moorena sp. SIO3E8]NEQ04040.1 filamentous hemagglutinin N-terminal domain-containing protein [Moorena sp. SIO3F7]
MKPRIDRLVAASPFVLCSLLAATTALGQITPDNTLGNESSVVTNLNINGIVIDLIEGGAIRDSNLFHSFSDFNVAEFAGAYFDNPAGVANILSRVTGGNVSNILGTLGVLGNANLFLINPNGIVFGPNSRLDVGGSFFGSTAESVLFEDGKVFSTKNPNDKPLLTINIPSGLQYGSNPGSITNQSSLFRVPNGQTLGLIGGEVTIPGGQLRATDGRIELGSVGANGVVKLTPTDTSFGLDYSGVNEFQDISLSEGARVITSGEGGGSIQVQGANVSLRDRSRVLASTLRSQNGGGIVVEASQLSLEGGSQINTNVLGSGQGGKLTVDASESVRVIGVSADGTLSALGAQVFPGATGNGGNLSITTGQLMVSDGAVVSAGTFGEGDGGDLTVNADSRVQLIGTTADGQFASRLTTQANQGSIGKAGNLSITTGQLMVSDGAVVLAVTFGEGDGGNLSVNADSTVQVIGTTADGRILSGLFTDTFGTGKAGNLSITTGQLRVFDGAVVSAGTFGEGESGNLTVDASSTVQVIGTTADGRFPSGLFTVTFGTGKAGNLSITTGQLMVSDGAVASAATFGLGDGGNLTVDASSTVQLIGTSADAGFPSGLLALTQGIGKAVDLLKITTGQLMVSDGAVVSASTFGEKDEGNLSVNADSTVQLIGTSADGLFGSGLFTQAQGTGKAGELLKITTGQLMVSDGAVVSARSFEKNSSAGEVKINANSIFLNKNGIITAETGGDKGNIRPLAKVFRGIIKSCPIF